MVLDFGQTRTRSASPSISAETGLIWRTKTTNPGDQKILKQVEEIEDQETLNDKLLQEARIQQFCNRGETFLVLLSVVIVMGILIYNSIDENPTSFHFALAIPALRIFLQLKTMRKITYTLCGIFPEFSSLFALLFIVFYIYAIYVGKDEFGRCTDCELRGADQLIRYSF